MTPSIFLSVIDGKLVLWDYVKHEQYEIKIAHLSRILEVSAGESLGQSDIDVDLTNAGVFSNPEPELWGWDCLSRIFHIGTQIGLNADFDEKHSNPYRGYIDYCASIADKIPEMFPAPAGEPIRLPDPNLTALESISLKDSLFQRRTCRSFDGKVVSLTDVSDALYATFAAVHGNEREDLERLGLLPVGYRRTSPSGGSLHPSECYLVALRVTGLAPGMYHYKADEHRLTRVRGVLNGGELAKLLCAQNFAKDLSYGVFVISVFSRMWWKYPHSRAYRVALLDVGCIVQTFQLVCTEQKIQSWPTGYLNDHKVNALLGLDGVQSSVIFFLGAGYGDGSVAPEALQAIHEMQNSD
jgi:SagB-type dehydrogenase family enzyme